MKKYFFTLFYCLLLLYPGLQAKQAGIFFEADNPGFLYTGRIDFSNPKLPRFCAPGVYIEANFKGTSCKIKLIDEELYGNYHNYISVVIDGKAPARIKLQQKVNEITVGAGLTNSPHTLLICKSTESGIGFLEFAGISCEALLKKPEQPLRRMEFIGNSITCGMAADLSQVACGKGEWYDQHNAYMSYGPLTARNLKAQWQLTAVSGIGLMHSCCDLKFVMPEIYDHIFLQRDNIKWDVNRYQPDVLTICLGQNDGIRDDMAFCAAYIDFVKKLRTFYPKTTIVCLTSPMADENLVLTLKRQLNSIIDTLNRSGDTNVYKYFFNKRYFHGCDAHPDLAEHRLIAEELTAFIKRIKKW